MPRRPPARCAPRVRASPVPVCPQASRRSGPLNPRSMMTAPPSAKETRRYSHTPAKAKSEWVECRTVGMPVSAPQMHAPIAFAIVDQPGARELILGPPCAGWEPARIGGGGAAGGRAVFLDQPQELCRVRVPVRVARCRLCRTLHDSPASIAGDTSGLVVQDDPEHAQVTGVLSLAVGLPPSFGSATPEAFIAADMDADGQVSALDALEILRAAVGLWSDHAPRWVFVDADADLTHIDRDTVEYDTGVMVDTPGHDVEIGMTGILTGSMQEYA